jgi:alkylhydroperoxidase family enzyme
MGPHAVAALISMANLPYADTESAPSSIREVLDRHPVSVLRMLAHAQSVFGPWLDYTGALLGEMELDPVLREFAILRLARLRGSDYQWVQHVAIARALGATGGQIAAIKDDREEDPSLTASQRAVLGFTREVTVEGAASEHAVAAVAGLFGPRAVIELLLVIGQWLALCSFVNTLALQPDLPAMASALPDTLALRTTPDA